MLNNKKAQVGETITWIIATIVLVAILITFIFISASLSKVKSLKTTSQSDSSKEVDWINTKTKLAYSINPENRNIITLWISKEGEYDE